MAFQRLHHRFSQITQPLKTWGFVAAWLLGITAHGQGVTSLCTLHQFGGNSDGYEPVAALLPGSDGRLYGAAFQEGPNSGGTLFAINPDGSGFVTLHSFTTALGDPGGTAPLATLIQGWDGRLYGATWEGGYSNGGAIFAVHSDGTGFVTLHSLAPAEGAAPGCIIQGSDGRLYGIAQQGPSNAGTVYSLNSDGSGFAVLHVFSGGSDGVGPQGIIQGIDGRIYGTTGTGGSGYGTVFALTTDGTRFTTLYAFTNQADGSGPQAIMQASDGKLCGMAGLGGTGKNGTIFSLGADGSGFVVLHSFTGGQGGTNADTALLQGSDGRLYGSTTAGQIFALQTDGSGFTALYTFSGGLDGSNPHSRLTQLANGRFVGTTNGTGEDGSFGTLYALTVSPGVTALPQALNVPAGAYTAFTATGPVAEGTTYQWQLNGLNYAGATAPTFAIPSVDATFAGTYALTETGSTGSATKTIVAVLSPQGSSVTTPPPPSQSPTAPQIVTPPQGVIALIGGSATFTVGATNASAYQWLFNGAGIPGATSASLTLAGLTAAQAGSYSVYVANGSGSVTSSVVTLTVLPLPKITSAASASAYVGIPFTYQITANNQATSYSASGLPPGVGLDSITGLLSGTPSATGTYNAALSAINAVGTAVGAVTIPVGPTPTLVTPTPLSTAFISVGGIVGGPAGNLYVSDAGNDTISQVSPQGVITRLAGSANQPGGFDGTGTAALFNKPGGLAIDSTGNLYVADTGNSTIRKIAPGGVVTTLAGFAGLTGAADGTGNAARFNQPHGVAVDGNGNVYVSDAGNATIRRITPGGVVSTVAGSPGQTGSANGVGSAARFTDPTAIATDGSGTIYVMDTQSQGIAAIRRITSGGPVTTLASGIASATAQDVPTPPQPIQALTCDSAGNVFYAIGPYATIVSHGDYGVELWEIPFGGAARQLYLHYGAVGESPNAPLGNSLLTALWKDGGSNLYCGSAGIYRVSITPASGPTIGVPPQSQEEAPGEAVTLSVGATASSALTYQWQFDGSNLVNGQNDFGLVSGAQSASLVMSHPHAGRYRVLVSSPYGAVMSAPATVIIGTGLVILNQPVSETVTAGAAATFSVTASTGAAYQWQFNGANIPGAANASLVLPSVTAAQAGSYTVVVGVGVSYLTSTPAILTVNVPPPAAPAISSPPASQSVALGRTATFSADATGSGMTYQWEKNGVPIVGATSASYSIGAVQATDAGAYSVLVTNTGGSIQSQSATMGVDVAPGAAYLATWTAAAELPTSTLYTAASYDGSHFLVAGSDGTLRASTDAANWTSLPSAPGRLNTLVNVGAPYGFVGVGDHGVILSFLAPTYAAMVQSSGTTNLLTGLAAGNGRMVAVGVSGTALDSPLATPQWAPTATGTTENLDAVAFGNGLFVAVGLGGTVLTSPDGLQWTQRSLPAPGADTDLYSVAWGAAGFVAIGSDASGSDVFTSPDGITWNESTPMPGISLIRLGYAAGIFIAVGGNGSVATSTDQGVTWNLRNSGTTATLEGVAYGQNRFLAAGQGGEVTVSTQASARLVNISTRAAVGSGSPLAAGFTTSGSGALAVLIRGIGPTLAQFGVPGALPNPQLTLYNGQGEPIAGNAGWGGGATLSAAFAQVGAFALPLTSADAALLETLGGGSYSAQVTVAAGAEGGGVALAEIYDASIGASATRLVNVSTLAGAGTGANALAAGFAISGNAPDTLLIRGVGPGLSFSGLSGLLANPVLTLYDSTGKILASNAGWGGSSTLAAAFGAAGAFALPASSADSALLVALPPGVYSAQVSGQDGTTGTALIELYEVTPSAVPSGF